MNSVPFRSRGMLLSCSHYKEKGERHGRCEPMCEKTTRAARCAHDARALARFAEARRAYGAHGPQARCARTLGPRWIRWQSACNPRWKQGHATWKTRWNRVGFAPDPRGIPARPTPTKRKMASLQWKSGPAQTKQRTGGAFGEDRHARNLHLLRHQNHNQLREERSAPQGALPCFLRRLRGGILNGRRAACGQASSPPDETRHSIGSAAQART